MVIRSKLAEKDFINVSFLLLYSKTAIKIFTGMVSVAVLIMLFTIIVIPKAHSSQIIVPLIMMIALPLLTYISAKRGFKSNQRISETIEYQFEQDFLSMKGETFNAQLSWEKIHKVTKTKNWILIWQNSQMANPIHKRDVQESQISELKDFLESHHVKNNL
jgi:hypothetical protein